MEQILLDGFDLPPATAKPFVKWAGGKQALADFLIQQFPPEYERFFEPFVGGGSIFLTLNHPVTTICDHNRWLIDTYKAIQLDWRAVCRKLDVMKNTKEEFLTVRHKDPFSLSLVERAANFIYLNKTCFRGLFRTNRKGNFNVPYGAYNRRFYDSHNLAAVAEILKRVNILSGDFEVGIADVREGDFVYFDPPYYKLGGFSDFNRYTENQFRDVDHRRLATVCRELDEKGAKWIVSNSNTDFIKEIFDGFEFLFINNRREINLNSKNRSIVELLIKNY